MQGKHVPLQWAVVELSALTNSGAPKKPAAALQVQAPLLSCRPSPEQVEEKSTQFTVHDLVAHDQEAELEVQTDAWNSYEELRELVVDAVPNMFRDTDELTLEYKNEQSRWIRVKMKTPVDAVKAARCARITVPSRGSSRALRR